VSETNAWRRPRGRNRIDLRNPEDVRIWTMSLGVSEAQLRAAIAAAGAQADKVREYLARH